jgi:hypothetical protein
MAYSLPSYSASVSFDVYVYIPGIDASVLYRKCFNEKTVHLFFFPVLGRGLTSNGPAIVTDGKRDSTAANPDNCVSLIRFLPGESPVRGKGSNPLC